MGQKSLKQKIFAVSSIALGVVFLMTLLIATVSADSVFFRNLRIGDSGDDVLALQKFLNKNLATRVAFSGPGSIDNETRYFGPLTRQAVTSFQELYASKILTPLGLVRGTGFFGPLTRSEILALLAADNLAPQGVSKEQNNKATQTSGAARAKQAFEEIPNSENLDLYIETVKEVATEKGTDQATIAVLENQIRAEAATTTSFRKKFIEAVEKSNKVSEKGVGTIRGLLSKLLEIISPTNYINVSEAQTEIAFGGKIFYVFPCTCSGAFQIGLSPLPPTYVSLLDYFPGTAIFPNYNLPFANYVLGSYTFAAPACYIIAFPVCLPIPSRGIILPKTGSSI